MKSKSLLKLVGLCIVTALVCVSLMGCPATWQLPENATPAEKQVAMCSDARKAVALGAIGLGMATGKAERRYYEKWLKGAQDGVDLYCADGM